MARNRMGLTRVIGPSEEIVMVEKVDKEGIENVCLNENQRRFTQPHGTPCIVFSLSDELGLLGTGQASEDILKGRYVPLVIVDNGIRNILSHLKCPSGIKINTQLKPITCEKYRV